MSTPITIGGISCYELWREGRAESAIETYKEDSISAVRKLRCAWTDRLALTRKLKGGATGAGTLQAPAKYPAIPECYVKEVHIEGAGKSSQVGPESLIGYTDAILTVTYETPDYKVLNHPNAGGQLLLRESMDYTAQFLTIPDQDLKWTSNNADLDDKEHQATSGKVMGMSEYTITAFHHPFPNWTAIENAVGKLHNGVFAPLTRSFPDGTLLFIGVHDEVEFIMDPFGNLTIPAWTVAYKFAYRRERWNTAYRSSTGIFEDYANSNGVQVYGSANLYAVF